MRTPTSKGKLPGDLGQFGWYGIATTHRAITLVLIQHLPFDQHGFLTLFNTLFYSARD